MAAAIDRPTLRKLMEDTFRTDADFDAFVLDRFPVVHRKFAGGMNRIQKLNLLLESNDTSEILHALLKEKPALAVGLPEASASSTAAQPVTTPTLVEKPSSAPIPAAAQMASSDSLPPPKYLLHLSDLHFSDENQADQWHAQLLLDLRKQMQIRELSGVIVSGDITNHATDEQFGFAQDFFQQLCASFRIAKERLILVPGNHDVNWKLTDVGQDGFSPFAAFYRNVTGADYPSSPAQQTTLHHFPELKLLVLGCNSACQIDRANPSRAGLHKRAFGKAISSLVHSNEEHEKCTKLAVWHHPPAELTQGIDLQDGAVLEQLAQAGFQLVLHGHVHRADNAVFRYYRQVSGGGLEILTAGTFGAPTHELVSGYPFQYQVLEFRGDLLTVHTRKRENVAGGWIADHRWSQAPGQSPESFYKISLRFLGGGHHSHRLPKMNLKMALTVIGGLLLLVLLVRVPMLSRSPEPPAPIALTVIVVTQAQFDERLSEKGLSRQKIDTPEDFAEKVRKVSPGQLRYEVSTEKDQVTNELLRWVLALLRKDNQFIGATKYGVQEQRAWSARVTPQARALVELTEGIERKLEKQTLFDLATPTVADMMKVPSDFGRDEADWPDLAGRDLGTVPTPIGMVKIPEGSFLMGSNDGDEDEKPVHRVTLPTYYLDLYEVTTEQYGDCVRAGGCQEAETGMFCNAGKPERAKHPVNCVDWSQAAAYCKWAGKRLPTEEEWEYAARGTEGRKYPWGNEKPRAGLLNACGSECVALGKTNGFDGWKSMYSGNDGWEMTAPVGSVKGDRSPFGVMDLGGNVTEWVQDWYRDSYRTSGGPTKMRSLRGGSWDRVNPSYARAPDRYGDSPVDRNSNVGFRCARTK